ncbi:hypothetical protein D8I24_5536 [Cupriavidus necator H850]|nr:hypothetical protein D8I24_5536 [Cupriavidus necator H850]
MASCIAFRPHRTFKTENATHQRVLFCRIAAAPGGIIAALSRMDTIFGVCPTSSGALSAAPGPLPVWGAMVAGSNLPGHPATSLSACIAL